MILVITLLPKLASIANSFTVIGSSPASSGAIGTANIGNLVSPISLFAVFSQWPIDDFRYQPHGLLRDLMVVLGVAVAAYGAVWWSRRRDFVIPAGALTALAIFLLGPRARIRVRVGEGAVRRRAAGDADGRQPHDRAPARASPSPRWPSPPCSPSARATRPS